MRSRSILFKTIEYIHTFFSRYVWFKTQITCYASVQRPIATRCKSWLQRYPSAPSFTSGVLTVNLSSQLALCYVNGVVCKLSPNGLPYTNEDPFNRSIQQRTKALGHTILFSSSRKYLTTRGQARFSLFVVVLTIIILPPLFVGALFWIRKYSTRAAIILPISTKTILNFI